MPAGDRRQAVAIPPPRADEGQPIDAGRTMAGVHFFVPSFPDSTDERSRSPVRQAAGMRRLLTILGAAIVLRVVAGIVAEYPGYLPTPDFRTEFLAGREDTFDVGGYRVAFVAHLLAGPPTLLLGLLLAVPALRQRAPHWHARLGRLVVALALLVVAPSGLVMARHPLPSLSAPERAVAGLGFATLAFLTGVSATLGFVAARRRRFADHERWMTRLLALLVSAVVLRVIGGATSLLLPDAPWSYAANAWASWLLPLVAFEAWHRAAHRKPITADRTSPEGCRPPA
jgi:hypothetical protein